MNKKQDPNFHRKDLMLPKSEIAKYDNAAKVKKMSTKRLMENVLIENSDKLTTLKRKK
jgi:hypothetical protein